MSDQKVFTIRVYGLIVVNDQILLSRENIKGGLYTKFPGGGLEFGEGIIDCLRRELREEAEIEINNPELFYFNEDFVSSGFHEKLQVISFYYKAECDDWNSITTADPALNHLLTNDGDQVLFWKYLKGLQFTDVDLPIDQRVVEKIISRNP